MIFTVHTYCYPERVVNNLASTGMNPAVRSTSRRPTTDPESVGT